MPLDRDLQILNLMRDDRIAAIHRKRSWRASEKAMSIVETQRLTEKLTHLLKDFEEKNG